MGIENEARVTGDRVCEMFTRGPKHCAFARSRGLIRGQYESVTLPWRFRHQASPQSSRGPALLRAWAALVGILLVWRTQFLTKKDKDLKNDQG